MRIAVANNFFPPRTGGSAHLSEALAAQYASAGHEVLVITAEYGGAPLRDRMAGFDVVRLRSWKLPRTRLSFNFDINFAFTPRNLRRLYGLLDSFGPDVIHQHGQFFDLTFMTAAYGRRRGIPLVLSVHTRLEHPSRLANAVLTTGDLTLVRAFMEIGRPHVIAMDKLMKRYITKRYGVPGDRIVPIPVGVDPTRFGLASSRDVRAELGLGDAPIVLSLGHVIPVRDRLSLVEAMPGVLKEYPKAVLVVVGRVYDRVFLERAAELGISHSVIATGGIDKDEVPAYVQAADVEAHDLSGYGLGTASLEVMAAGVPVVAAVDPDNFLGLELRSGRDVLLVPPDDPVAITREICRVLGDRELRDRLVRGQRALIEEHFLLERVAGRHLELFSRVAG